ncbi:hypothetical protein GCM10017786_76050 [Amycolatopsis deserti]|uniref:Uncharacterized protein n=1 Tax=Amycolatopsis deserti TaxID=185696 RepID=A0ABQ3JI02_9PSEU|nr:hypothetical protein [Amycolatopsis deserti]GHF30924.1 hypothetical protein GCM10017786_76050 [Amycolatopsis deserti]
MTTSADHTITVTELTEDDGDLNRPVRVECSCGDLSEEVKAVLADGIARVHVERATRPNAARAYEIGNVLMGSDLPPKQALAVSVALLEAADLADGIGSSNTSNSIVKHLLRAVRGEQ